MSEQTSDAKTRALHEAYRSTDPAATSAVYDDWSDTYETHMLGVGYAHPAMVAGILCRHQPAGDGAILDAGCGTGIMGELLTALGYTDVSGFDASAGMLARAERRGIYRDLKPGLLGRRLDYDDDRFEAAVAAGVFTQGHAPLDGLDELVRVTKPGGHVVFSIARTLLGEAFEAKAAALEAAGLCRHVDASGHYDSTPLSDDVLTSQVMALKVA